MRRGHRGYNPYIEQQIADPGMINIAPVQMYNPEDTQRLAQVGQQMQKRWDASQGLIAQHLEAMGAANINPRYRDEVMGQLEGELESLYGDIEDKYEGDFGRAVNEVGKSLAGSRALLHQATRTSEEEAKAREQFQNLKVQGKAPHSMVRDPETGQLHRREMGFEEYHNLAETPFDEQGRFTGYQFNPLRGAADITGYLAQNVSQALNRMGTHGRPQAGDVLGMLTQYIDQGMSNPDIQRYLQGQGDALANQLRQEIPHLSEELGDVTNQELIEYITPIVQNQVAHQQSAKYMKDPTFGVGSDTPPGGYTKNVYNTEVEMGDPRRRRIDQKYNYSNFTPTVATDIDVGPMTARREKQLKERRAEQQKGYDEEARIKLENFKEKNPIIGYLEGQGYSIQEAFAFAREQDLRYNATTRTAVGLHSPAVSKKIIDQLKHVSKDRMKSLTDEHKKAEDMFHADAEILENDVRYIPSTGEFQIAYINRKGDREVLKIKGSFLDTSSNFALENTAQFFDSLYDISRKPDEVKEVDFSGEKFNVVNILTENGIEVMIGPANSTSIDDFMHAEAFTGRVNQHAAQELLTGNSLELNIPKLKLDIWN